ncbi:ATP-grasp ribosomal peptide maturase [Crossiella sp. S99.2]|nr:ATP-grasp ribosomal peptide maturase [Crossiella sp. S99.2]MCK2253628.1 ATP-grasp ribosomal peptide maturase [Crossiella sp. S99.1]
MVVSRLHDLQVPLFRTDVADFPQCLKFEARLISGRWIGKLADSYRSVDLEDIRSVYYRRPTMFRVDSTLAGVERSWCASEARFGFGGVLSSLPALYVNHPTCNAAASYKPYHLQVATDVGLMVPKTIVTNIKEAARTFFSRTGSVVYKTLCGTPFTSAPSLLFTSPVIVDELDESIELTAHKFQERLEKEYELRVTVVGERVFVARIDALSSAAKIDWRRDYANLKYTSWILPDEVKTRTLKLVKRLGLQFAAIDMIVTPSGDHFLIDVNPNGQWGWIEEETALPISQALARLLSQGNSEL